MSEQAIEHPPDVEGDRAMVGVRIGDGRRQGDEIVRGGFPGGE
jgi:hypothetical protein